MGRIRLRYICREVVTPFLLGLLIFTLILLTARILKLVELVVNRGVPVWYMVKIFCYATPAFFEVTVPMAFLVALFWGFGRLSADREITALKSCGLSFYQIALPVGICVAVVLSGTFFTLAGSEVRDRIPSSQASAGLLVFFNTSGAAAGALVGGLLLVPRLGIERAFFPQLGRSACRRTRSA